MRDPVFWGPYAMPLSLDDCKASIIANLRSISDSLNIVTGTLGVNCLGILEILEPLTAMEPFGRVGAYWVFGPIAARLSLLYRRFYLPDGRHIEYR